MVFSSFPFLWIFLPLVCAGILLLRKKGSNLFLLAASIFFYAWGEPKYVVLLLFSISINYLGGLFFLRERTVWLSRLAVGLMVVFNLALLGYFKYFNFFAQTLNSLAAQEAIPLRSIALPIGISFYSFQAISYIVDVSRKEIRVQSSWFKLALYISFFPQLVAGPIVKYKDVENQLDRREISLEGAAYGIRRFCFGLAKKVIIANSLGHVVDKILSQDLNEVSALLCWTAAIFYTLQIYYDFSGYSDMAIGLARVFGFNFKENFNFPYLSLSVQEFWRRWHISLSTWFRDYLYIPLGGNRKGLLRTLLNLLIVFFMTGLWHGAQWNFVFWGVYHGCFLILERLCLVSLLEKIRIPVVRSLYSLAVVITGWVFFRADDLPSAFLQLSRMVSFSGSGHWNFSEFVSPAILLIFALAVLLSGVAQTWLVPAAQKLVPSQRTQYIISCCWALLCLVLSFVMLANAIHNPFIYFRF